LTPATVSQYVSALRFLKELPHSNARLLSDFAGSSRQLKKIVLTVSSCARRFRFLQ